MPKIKHKPEVMHLVVVVAIAIFIALASILIYNTTSSINKGVNQYSDRLASQKSNFVKNTISYEVKLLVNFSACLSNYKTIPSGIIVKDIAALEKSITTAEAIFIADENGDVITSKNVSMNVSHREYFRNAIKGKTCVSKPLYSEPDGKMVNFISVPIYGDYKRIIGIVVGVYEGHIFSDMLDMSFSGIENDSNGYILNNNGEVIMHGNYVLGDDVPQFDSFFSSELLGDVSETDIATVRDNFMKVGSSGIIKTTYNNERYVIIYDGFSEIDDLHYLVIAKDDVVSAQTNSFISKSIIMYIFFIVVLLLVIVAYILIVRLTFKRLKSANERISRIAYVDSLTGYSTWDKFVLDAKKLLQYDYRRYALVSFDIDKFKAINDMYGHDEGNRVLKLIADTVNRNIENTETFSRINSDNYYILMLYHDDSQISERIRNLIQAIEYEITEFVPVLSFGVYRILDSNVSIRRMGDLADIAKRTVKYGDDSAYAFYTESMLESMREEKRIENEMQNALDMHEFCVFYQPKVSLDGNVNLTGAEALVRWIKDGNVISPGKFIPLFERNRFIVKLDFYIMDQVCIKIKQWQKYYKDLLISVNMSRVHLKDPQFAEKLYSICASHNVSPSNIEIEITESAAYESLETLVNVFRELKEYGFNISIDDFGSGYSSLNMLKDLPADVLKIDRAFLAETDSNKRANDILGHVIRMASSLGMHTICEGIETDEQAKLLGGLGCEMAQGFYFAKPMPSDSFEEILKGNSKTINIPKEALREDT